VTNIDQSGARMGDQMADMEVQFAATVDELDKASIRLGIASRIPQYREKFDSKRCLRACWVWCRCRWHGMHILFRSSQHRSNPSTA
jgi:hypothetical protein